MSEPHILLVGGDGGRSGVPRYLSQIVRALGEQVRLSVISDENRGGYDFVEQAGLSLHEITGYASGVNLIVRLRAMGALGRVIRSAPPDLIWAHARMAVLLVRARALLHRRTPVAVTFHGLPFGAGHQPLMAWFSLRLERMFCHLMPSHHLLFLSEEAKRLYCRQMPVRALARHHTYVLNNCSDIGDVRVQPHPTGSGMRMVMFGRAGHQKNVFAAAPILAALPADVRLTLCGIDTDTPAMRAAFAGCVGQVDFVGEVSDVRPYLAAADMFLMTSRYEGMPIAALEAFEVGLPMALSDILGTAEISNLHPLVTQIDTARPKQAASQILALFEIYKADPKRHQSDIRHVWAAHFSYDIWAKKLRSLVQPLTL